MHRRIYAKRKRQCLTSEKYERCVLCGRLTEVPAACPTEWREYFVPGGGQLCSACGERLRSGRDGRR